MTRSLRRSTIIGKDEEQQYLLCLMSPKAHIKRLGLIRLCEALQQGRIFRTQQVHQQVRSLVFQESEVERWALKALVEFADPRDYELVKARLTQPPSDLENLSCAIAAYFAVADEGQVEEAFASGLITRDGLTLLAHTFASAPGTGNFPEVQIDIQNATPLELKWSCLCLSSGRMGDHVFDPRFDQVEQLAALNLHHEEEVSQYSIYAMNRMGNAGYSDLRIPLIDIRSKPEGVRKWSYRLFTGDTAVVRTHLDFVQQVARFDDGVRAQEGMAIGLIDVWVDGIDTLVVDWLARQPDERVEMALLSHMARHSSRSPAYEAIVQERFADEGTTSLTRNQLLIASASTPLYGVLKNIAANENELGDMFGDTKDMGNNNIFIYGGNNRLGAVSTGGIVSTGEVRQDIKTTEEAREVATKIAAAVKEQDEALSMVVVDKADKFFEDPSASTAKDLHHTVGSLERVVGSAANIATLLAYLGTFF